MFDFLIELQDATVSMLGRIVFNKGSSVHRTLMALYSSIIEQVDAAIALRHAGKAAGVETILRSSLGGLR